jgi:hypothetical protein
MSMQALTWAMEHAPITDPTCRSVLFVQANIADEEGHNAFLSVDRIAYCTGFSERTIRRALDRMTAEGIIRPQQDTSQRDATIKDPGRRPDVYELAMHRKRPTYAEYRAQRGGRQVPEGHPWDDLPSETGATAPETGANVSADGCQSDTQPVLDPSKDPFPLPTGEGAHARAHAGAHTREADDDPPQLALVAEPEEPAEPAKGKRAKAARRSRGMTEDWALSEEMRAKTLERYPLADVDEEVAAFVNWHMDPNRVGQWSDYDRAWWHWMRRAKPKRSPNGSSRPGSSSREPYRDRIWEDGTADASWDSFMAGGKP